MKNKALTEVKIEPLSTNNAWQGRRVKTAQHRKYCKDVPYLLPLMPVPKGQLLIVLEFGFSSKASDWDNPIKAFQDILAKRYGFNDNSIYTGIVFKEIVPKGQEYIKFKLVKKPENIKDQILDLL